MICIFSTSLDITTTEVIRWLNYLGYSKPILRINADQLNAEPIKIALSDNNLFFNWDSNNVHLDEIEAVWYRKGRNWLANQFSEVIFKGRSSISAYINNRLKEEEQSLSTYLHELISCTVPTLGNPILGSLNKLKTLRIARNVGFKIPEFCVTNDLAHFETFLSTYDDCITKAIADGVYMFDWGLEEGYFSYTERLADIDLDTTSQPLKSSLLQRTIQKKYDLRVFFLDGICYSMAICSQNDSQTSTDFRKYNESRPNRAVPYRLSAETEQKIQLLFHEIKLNTGSVDLIIDKLDEVYFLEINPVGQFGMVSTPCNYELERIVAQTLINYAKRRS